MSLYKVSHAQYQVSFYLWWMEAILKFYRILKCSQHDCTFTSGRLPTGILEWVVPDAALNIHCFSKVMFSITAWKVSQYGVFSGPYFPVFGPENTPYFDTFHAVNVFCSNILIKFRFIFRRKLIKSRSLKEIKTISIKQLPQRHHNPKLYLLISRVLNGNKIDPNIWKAQPSRYLPAQKQQWKQ